MSAKLAKKLPIDTLWFRQMIERAGLSQNETAARMKMDRGALSKLLRGERRMQIADLKLIAAVLGVSEEETLRHAGVDLKREEVESALPLPVARVGTVEWPSGDVRLPKGLGVTSTAPFYVRLMGGPFKGNQLLLRHDDGSLLERDGVHVGAIVTDDKRILLRRFKRGFDAGFFDIDSAMGMGSRKNKVAITRVYVALGMLSLNVEDLFA